VNPVAAITGSELYWSHSGAGELTECKFMATVRQPSHVFQRVTTPLERWDLHTLNQDAKILLKGSNGGKNILHRWAADY
jgi:hypothetical protein